MKKFLKSALAISLCFIMLCSSFAMGISASAETVESGKCGDNVYWTLDDEGTLTISGTGKMKDYYYFNVDDYYNTSPWYDSQESIKNVVIGPGVTSIGRCAFYNCKSLESITILEGVTSIGYTAFLGCLSLTSITIPDSVTSIGYGTFEDCSSLTSITIPNSVKSIGGSAFSGCSSITSLTVDKDNTIYDSRNNCNAIIETATNTLIAGCKNTIIPDSVTSIGGYAFNGCTGLKSIIIPNSVTSIGNHAFYLCTSLESITIPDSVTSIGDWAFGDCSSLTSITIPDSVTSIGYEAFYGCSSLKSITIPEGVTSIGIGTFDGCSNLTSIIIPDSVTSIGSSAFANCTSLENITILEGVTSIGDFAFSGCIRLSSITVDKDNSVYDSRNNCNAIIETATNKLIYGCNSTIIPDSVTSIGDWAFGDCSSLTSITIPDSVTSIGNWTFALCANLERIIIPNSVTSIGEDAFAGCSSLTSTIIPNSVTSIGFEAFAGCSSLKSIIIPDSVTSIGDRTFSWCESLSSITVDKDNTIYDSRNNCNAIIETATNTLIAGCKNTIIPDSVTSIGYEAFSGCTGLTSITIPDGVTSIGNGTFDGCSSLTGITIPEGVTSIGENAFVFCSSLTSITIPDSVISIGDFAFVWCASLIDVSYSGSENDRSKIDIGIGNEYLENATWHYKENSHIHTDANKDGYCDVCKAVTNADFANPCKNAKVNVATTKTVDYKSIITIKATASGVPTGYSLVMYVNGKQVAKGSNTEVTYTVGQATSDINYTVKVIDAKGNVQKDSTNIDLAKDSKITVNSSFFAKIIAFFKSLFGSLLVVTIKP